MAFGDVDEGTSVRPDYYDGVHGGVSDDEAIGGVHDESVRVEVLNLKT